MCVFMHLYLSGLGGPHVSLTQLLPNLRIRLTSSAFQRKTPNSVSLDVYRPFDRPLKLQYLLPMMVVVCDALQKILISFVFPDYSSVDAVQSRAPSLKIVFLSIAGHNAQFRSPS